MPDPLQKIKNIQVADVCCATNRVLEKKREQCVLPAEMCPFVSPPVSRNITAHKGKDSPLVLRIHNGTSIANERSDKQVCHVAHSQKSDKIVDVDKHVVVGLHDVANGGAMI
ncbi:hypothetical protein C0J52_00711 [Blattella germanica]|nr:hypothetical protein C0J52_00711 [Blattella germanica]